MLISISGYLRVKKHKTTDTRRLLLRNSGNGKITIVSIFVCIGESEIYLYMYFYLELQLISRHARHPNKKCRLFCGARPG